LIITGDTRWNKELERAYKKNATCREKNTVLIPHISTVCAEEILGIVVARAEGKLKEYLDYHGPFCSNHLGIHGLCRAIETFEPERVYLSEIGEELEGILVSLCTLVKKYYGCECWVGRIESAIDCLDGRHKPYFKSLINLSELK
jgi:hypothetical protein